MPNTAYNIKKFEENEINKLAYSMCARSTFATLSFISRFSQFNNSA